MNASLALIQKVRNIALAGTGDFTEGLINYPLLAYPLNAEDFSFLQDHLPDTPESAKAYWSSKYQFALLANSIPTRPFIWNLDPENLLYNSYKTVLSNANLIAMGSLSAEEQNAVDAASKLLYTTAGADTEQYTTYKQFSATDTTLQKKIMNLQLQINSIDEVESPAKKTLTDELNLLQAELEENGFKWISVGHKLAIENARNILASMMKKDQFVQKWQAEKSWMNEDSNAKNTQDEENANFFETTCTPKDFIQPGSDSWQKFELTKSEIADLIAQYQKEVSNEITEQFGNTDVKLESIKFELCMLNIIRNWYKPELLASNLWKLPDGTQLSAGDNTYGGKIPCYPVKLVLVKNVEFKLSEDPANKDFEEGIKIGTPLFLANFIIKNKPGLASAKMVTAQTLSSRQLKNLAQGNDSNIKKIPQNKYTKLKSFGAMGFKAMKAAPIASVGVVKLHNPASIATKSAAASVLLKGHGHFSAKKKAILNPVILGHIDIAPAEPEIKKFSIRGKVTNASNQPVPGVQVVIQLENGQGMQTVSTNENGDYILQNLLPATYEASFSKEEYKTNETDIIVSQDTVSNVVLENDVMKEEYFVIAVLSKKLPKLPDPIPGANYI